MAKNGGWVDVAEVSVKVIEGIIKIVKVWPK